MSEKGYVVYTILQEISVTLWKFIFRDSLVITNAL